MAPDLNSVPASPRPLASSPRGPGFPTSRRASQQMLPPQSPLTSPGLSILPTSHGGASNIAPAMISPTLAGSAPLATTAVVDTSPGVGGGPGPLRHPRPLTAADLHQQLENEQEAVVNRLTRELSMLRAAQNASVVSNSSSTSAGFTETGDTNANHMLSGPSHPVPSQRRHHRSSSSTSTRSNTALTSISASTAGWTTSGVAGSIGSAATTTDRARAGYGRHDSNPRDLQSVELSRQNSINSSRRSGASSPALLSSNPSSYQHPEYFPTAYTQLPRRDPSATRVAGNNTDGQSERHASLTSVTSIPTTGRYDETAFYRHELDSVKRENEALKRRIRELERTIRDRRQSDASVADPRTRSESVSTSASMSNTNRDSIGGVGRGREREKESEVQGQEEVVRVGESARSGGLR